jgi:alpha-N-arabinofuranosidase
VLAVCLLFATSAPTPLLSQAISRYENSAERNAVITVFPNRRAPHRIPRTIYGTFLEHIGNSVFGGISAQLLDNPSLEPYPASLDNINKRFSASAYRQSTRFGLPLPWLPLRTAGRRYESRMGNAANSTSHLYVMGLRGREIGIRQQVFLPVDRELRYRGVLFVLVDAGPMTLTVSFRRRFSERDIVGFRGSACRSTRARLSVPAGGQAWRGESSSSRTSQNPFAASQSLWQPG